MFFNENKIAFCFDTAYEKKQKQTVSVVVSCKAALQSYGPLLSPILSAETCGERHYLRCRATVHQR